MQSVSVYETEKSVNNSIFVDVEKDWIEKINGIDEELQFKLVLFDICC